MFFVRRFENTTAGEWRSVAAGRFLGSNRFGAVAALAFASAIDALGMEREHIVAIAMIMVLILILILIIILSRPSPQSKKCAIRCCW